MKKIFYIALVLLAFTTSSYAQKFLNGAAEISDVLMLKNEETKKDIDLVFKIKLDGTQLKSNKEYHFTPVIQGENDLKKLQSVIVIGRKRQIYRDRNPRYFQNENALVMASRSKKDKEQVIEYKMTFEYEPWMQGAQLMIEEDECGCTGKVLAQATQEMNAFFVHPDNLAPYLVYVEPEIEENKIRSIANSAFIDYPINKTSIYPEYRKNPIELAKIRGAIDKVVYDPDIKVAGISLKGHASPDGRYAQNEELAKMRTNALKSYLLSLQIPGLTPNMVDVYYDAENWKGLEEVMRESDYTFKNQVLDILALEYNLDTRKSKLKQLNGGSTYRTLANEVFPALRSTDFEIKYAVRGFTPREANILIWTAPQKLSLQEIYTVTQFYNWDNIKYKEVFEIAVRMFPDDYVSNINASTNALLIKDLEHAEIYLRRIESDKRDGIYYNNLGTLYMLQKKYNDAEKAYVKAEELGSPEATKNLGILKYIIY